MESSLIPGTPVGHLFPGANPYGPRHCCFFEIGVSLLVDYVLLAAWLPARRSRPCWSIGMSMLDSLRKANLLGDDISTGHPKENHCKYRSQSRWVCLHRVFLDFLFLTSCCRVGLLSSFSRAHESGSVTRRLMIGDIRCNLVL